MQLAAAELSGLRHEACIKRSNSTDGKARRSTARTRFCCLRHALVQEANHAQLVVQHCQLQRLWPQNLLRLLGACRREVWAATHIGELLIGARSGQSGGR